MKKLSILIPVYNEKELIIEILKKIKKLEIENTNIEIIVIDDNSTDGTKEILQKQGNLYTNKIIYHKTNQGKGAALRTGFQEATGDVLIIQDADLEYNPEDIPKVVKPIFNNQANAVYGSRFLNKKYKGYKTNQLANRFLTTLSNITTGLKLTDMETCYKAFQKEFIKGIELKENRFGFEPEITAKIAKANLKIIEVPISYDPRTRARGKKIGIKDGFRAIHCILKYK